jgi:hypothetical protein
MEKLFQVVSLYKQSLFQKIFGQIPEENAVIEINNLLASKPIKSITNHDISSILAKYKANLYKTFRKNLYEFYAVYLNYCLKDKVLSDDELGELKHLKNLLNLNDNDVDVIHNKIAGTIYQESVHEAISDGRLDEAEKEFLEKLQKQLRLSEKTAKKLSGDIRGKFINDYLSDIVANERLSPEDEKEFQNMAKSLMIDVKLDEPTKARLEKFKLYWLIENGELTSKEVDINLQKSEKCYFIIQVDWYEQRTVTKRINYAGPTARIKIMKGVYYRVGSVSGERVTNEEWKLIDSGRVYLTNKRLIFMGSKKNSNIRLDKILSFTPYSDGIEINKETGRSPLLSFKDNVDIFGLLLSRLLRDV